LGDFSLTKDAIFITIPQFGDKGGIFLM